MKEDVRGEAAASMPDVVTTVSPSHSFCVCVSGSNEKHTNENMRGDWQAALCIDCHLTYLAQVVLMLFYVLRRLSLPR
jgi:hypothetical protein